MTPSKPVFIYREDGRLDYPAMRNVATWGTKSSRQIRAEAERAARKAAKVAEGTKPRRRSLPPRELPNGIE
ncbi:hypothetical protein [Methylobacterium sp. J-068]|uniref:hypothetical protein n=1 Tax=Methylobacterium sp. J-068 TaxID=2836649 RepID=UPI001FBB6E9D|nr:hypothetical protein [Methylobacterium sp. J-068]MCJ2032626.1 hypothetical protein [Methylobacterium sp. J-068]